MSPQNKITAAASLLRRRHSAPVHDLRDRGQDNRHLTAALAERVMKWKVAPNRFLLGNRNWIPRWRFQPTTNLEDAFRVLEQAKPEFYSMGAENCGTFSVEVRIEGKVGIARNESKPLAITVALAQALGL
jgi:hypothetical protein